MAKKLTDRDPLVFLAVFAVVLFISATVFFGWRDSRAVDRCEAMGGQTWDSGQHCAIGVDRVVDTHDRTWG